MGKSCGSGINLSSKFRKILKLVRIIKKNGGIERILREESHNDLLEFQRDFNYYHGMFVEWKKALNNELNQRREER